MRHTRLFGLVFSVGVQRELAHRANLALQLFLSAMSISAGAGAVQMLFLHVERLAGWTFSEVLILYGTYQVVSGLLESFVEPNLAWFAGKVTRGEVDDLLLQPVSSLFTATFGTCHPVHLAQAAMGAAIIGTGLVRSPGLLTLPGVVAFLLMLGVGLSVTWATRLALAALAFWAPGLEPSVLYFAFWQQGRYPTDVYHRGVRWVLTYVVPVAYISTVPARVLVRGADAVTLAGGAAVALMAVWAAARVWKTGLRRYTGATS